VIDHSTITGMLKDRLNNWKQRLRRVGESDWWFLGPLLLLAYALMVLRQAYRVSEEIGQPVFSIETLLALKPYLFILGTAVFAFSLLGLLGYDDHDEDNDDD